MRTEAIVDQTAAATLSLAKCPRSRRCGSAISDRLLAIVSSPVGFEHRRLTEPVNPSRTGLLAP